VFVLLVVCVVSEAQSHFVLLQHMQLQLYLKLINHETTDFSMSLWMKFLLALLPVQPSPSESQLSIAFLSIIDQFLLRCVDFVPKLKIVRVSSFYQPVYDSDEETIDTGHERYEALLRTSQAKVCFLCLIHASFVLSKTYRRFSFL